MCELLGLSARYPVTLEMSLQKLMQRESLSNPDGWGAVFYEKNDVYVFRRSHADDVHPPGLRYITRQCD